MKAILTKCLGYDENSPTFLYMKKSNRSLDSGLNINVPKMDFEEIVSYLKRKITRRFTHLYYALPPNNRIHDLSTELIPNDGSLEEAYAAQGKLKIYIDHVGVNFVIAKYICPNATLAEMMNHVITDYTSDNEDERKEVTQTDYTYDQMVEWAEQEHFEYEENKKFDLMKLCGRISLVDYLYVEMCIVGNHIVHILETVVCDVARMVEMRIGSHGKFVSRIGFVRTFMMGMGYDMMVAMVAHSVHDGCRKVVSHMLEIV
ncbi:hypothetical protein Tco_0309839 [Tanacetum coccineum]